MHEVTCDLVIVTFPFDECAFKARAILLVKSVCAVAFSVASAHWMETQSAVFVSRNFFLFLISKFPAGDIAIAAQISLRIRLVVRAVCLTVINFPQRDTSPIGTSKLPGRAF